jgi:hypothetical protein
MQLDPYTPLPSPRAAHNAREMLRAELKEQLGENDLMVSQIGEMTSVRACLLTACCRLC